MKSITLAKALKFKNRLAQKLKQLDTTVRMYNSVLKEQEGIVDVLQAMEDSSRVSEALISLKCKIFEANKPIQYEILKIGELKSTVAFLRGISTREGIERHDMTNSVVEYVAEFGRNEVEERIVNCEAEIDEIQDTIDTHNHTTKIEISDEDFQLI